jgi:hypothetical protein
MCGSKFIRQIQETHSGHSRNQIVLVLVIENFRGRGRGRGGKFARLEQIFPHGSTEVGCEISRAGASSGAIRGGLGKRNPPAGDEAPAGGMKLRS